MKQKIKNSNALKTISIGLVTLVLFSCKKEISNTGPVGLAGDTQGLALADKKENAAVALDWYKLQLRFLLERNSTINSAFYGYIGIGLYESVRYGVKNSVSFSSRLYQMPEMPAKENNNGYSWQVSANAAMASMVRSLNTGLTAANKASIDSLENAYNNSLSPAIGSTVFERSQTYGRAIATAMYNWYKTDNINLGNAGYVPPVFPGAWVPTPPAFASPIMPYVSAARPFLAVDLAGVSPAPLYAYSEVPGSDFYNMVKNVYDVSKTLTDAQKSTALFWVDQGNTTGFTPGGHDLSLEVQALETAHANLYLAAEVFAKAGIAEREAIIVGFRSKYTYNLIRPVSYIRKVIDATWSSFIPTPPHPEYPAAHAFVTGSAMQAVTEVLGDNLAFVDHTYDFRGISGLTARPYSSLNKAAEEAGFSRLYGGIHYVPSINAGLVLGRQLGSRAGKINLTQ
ncbi:MAG: vanadium-dependent haloperoxidase [Ferruginibacter sp.]